LLPPNQPIGEDEERQDTRPARRREPLSTGEIQRILERAGALHRGQRLQAILSLLWLFGKRIEEVLSLRREDVWAARYPDTGATYLYVRFHVQKKKEPPRGEYLKMIPATNPYAKYVARYIMGLGPGDPGDYLFPSRAKPRGKRWFDKRISRKTGEPYGWRERSIPGGHLTGARVRQLLKGIAPDAYPHLFRHSLATFYAERGATEDQLMAWFDWDSPVVAHGYVRRGGAMVRRLADQRAET